MAIPETDRPLKVCHTCRYWSYRYKGLCLRLEQGVGKFWTCEDWAAIVPAESDSAEVNPPHAAPTPSS
jgi:hypothetical protein